RALARDALVHGLQLVAELRLHPVAQHEARGEEGERRADRGSERDDDGAPHEAEDRTAREREDRRSRQREPGDRDVDREVGRGGAERMRGEVRLDHRALRLEEVEREIALEMEDEERRDARGDEREDGDAPAGHDGGGSAAWRGPSTMRRW